MARNYYNRDRANTKILDFGCGAGSNKWYLAREGFATYAFDGSASAVERAKKRLEADGLKADLRVGDALELDYECQSFDCVIDNAVVYANYYENIVSMYEEIYNLLKVGGKLFSSSFSTETTGYGTGVELEKNTYCNIETGSLAGRGTAHFFEEDELKDILEKVGFCNIVIDSMRYTDKGNVVEQFLVQAEK